MAALYGKADWFRGQAQHIPPELLDTWGRALAQVRRTAEIVGAGAIDEDTRRSAARLVGELRKEEQSVSERARQYRTSDPGKPGPAPIARKRHRPRTESRTDQNFPRAGVKSCVRKAYRDRSPSA